MPPDCFFDECDRRGLLVWEDFSRTSTDGQASACDAQLLLTNMRDCISRMRGHASILVWCGSNEALPQKDFGLAMQDQVLPEMDGTRPFLASSSSDGDWVKMHLHTWSGGPYGLRPLAEYFKLYAGGGVFACKNEIGLASPPPINTLARFIPDYADPDLNSFPLNRTKAAGPRAVGCW